MSSGVKKINWTEKTKDCPFPTFCKIVNQEAGEEVDIKFIQKFYKENLRFTIRTTVSKVISELKAKKYEADLEEWRGVAFGMYDFKPKDYSPEDVKQTWINFITDTGKVEELKCWGSHINNQKIPFGSLLELKGQWQEYTSPKTQRTYRNWVPRQLKILKELSRDERIEWCEKSYTPSKDFNKSMLYNPIIGFGEIGRVVSVTRFKNGVKDGSYDLYQTKRDGSETLSFSVVLHLQGPILITIDFEPQQLSDFFFDVLDFDEVADAAIQSENRIRELSNALRGRKIFFVGNFHKYSDGWDKQRNVRIFLRIRGTALIETDNFPKGYSVPKEDTTATYTQSNSEQESQPPTAEAIEYIKRVLPIMRAIAKLDKGKGVKIKAVTKEVEMKQEDVEQIIKEMINTTGDCYQPSTGYYKLLGEGDEDIKTYEERLTQSTSPPSRPAQVDDEEEEEEEDEDETKSTDLSTKILQRLLSNPKKWFEVNELMDLSTIPEELEQALDTLKSEKSIAKAKGKLKYRLKLSVKEAQKRVGSSSPPPSQSEYTKNTITTITEAIETLGENTTAEAILESGLVDDSIPVSAIQKIIDDIRKK